MAAPRATIDGDALCASVEQGGTLQDFAERIGVHPTTINNRLRVDETLRARVAAAREAHARTRGGLLRGQSLSSVAPSIDVPEGRLQKLKDSEVDALLRENGLNPAEWTIERATVNKWGLAPDMSTQVKAVLRPKIWMDTLAPAAVPPPLNLGKPRKVPAGEPMMIVAHGDDHAPYHDQALHEAFCRFLADVEPDAVVHLGDLLDFPTISKHRDDPSHAATPQECIDAAYQLLRDRRGVSPAATWWLIPGNHDDRLRTELLSRAERMFGIRPAPTDDEPDPLAALSLRRLLHLDGLGVELANAGDDGDYFHAKVQFGDTLQFVHGHFTGPTASQKHVERMGLNIVHGHTHDQCTHYVKRHLYGAEATLVAVAAGPMCHTDRRGASYAPSVDWHAGFSITYLWPDGHVDCSHARWTGDAIRWRGQAWRP